MTPIQWSEDLSVDIQEIDIQHRQLVELLSGLEASSGKSLDRESMTQVIRELNDYVREHFTAEERWMARFNYPGLDKHAIQHEEFIDRLLHLELDYLGGKGDITLELAEFLSRWFIEHVSGSDQLYAKYFREHGVV